MDALKVIALIMLACFVCSLALIGIAMLMGSIGMLLGSAFGAAINTLSTIACL